MPECSPTVLQVMSASGNVDQYGVGHTPILIGCRFPKVFLQRSLRVSSANESDTVLGQPTLHFLEFPDEMDPPVLHFLGVFFETSECRLKCTCHNRSNNN